MSVTHSIPEQSLLACVWLSVPRCGRMQRRDLWWRMVCPGTPTTPNPAARARAAASTIQEVSSQPINGKRHGHRGKAWKEWRGNWRNPRAWVREICWRKEETHLWESPPPSHTPLRVHWKLQVSGESNRHARRVRDISTYRLKVA